MSLSYKAYAPASISNLCVGFDILGLAVKGIGDYVQATLTDEPGVQIRKISGLSANVNSGVHNNTAAIAAQSFLSAINSQKGVSLEITKGIPLAAGLGGSAASSVATVVALNHLFKNPYKEKYDLLRFATAGERWRDKGLPQDNVAASLLGGLILSSPEDSGELRPKSLPFPHGLSLILITPKQEVQTTENRTRLMSEIPLSQHVHESFALATLINGLYRANWDDIKAGFIESFVDDQRSKEIMHYSEIKETLKSHDYLGFGISGSGPTMFAICSNTLDAEKIKEALMNMDLTIRITSPDLNGAVIC